MHPIKSDQSVASALADGAAAGKFSVGAELRFLSS